MDKQKKIKGGYRLEAMQTLTSEIWDKPAWWYKVWRYLIMKVNWKLDKRTGIQRGSGWFTYDKIYHDCHLHREHIRRHSIDSAISMLKLTTQITTRKTTRGFIVNIVNYSIFQDTKNYLTDTENDTPTDSKPTDNRQTTDTIIRGCYNKERSIVASPEALRLGRLLADRIKTNNPNTLQKDFQPTKWAEDIDKLFRLDKQSWSLIEKVLLWSQNDNFWKQVIKSGFKLRKQWSQLIGRMDQEKPVLEHHPSDYV